MPCPTPPPAAAAPTVPATPAEHEPPAAPPVLDILAPERQARRGLHRGERVVRIVRPRLEGVRRVETGVYQIVSQPEPKTWLGRGWRRLKRLLIGAPIRTEHEIHERLTKLKGLSVFASDNISSSAYATEEIMRVLVLAGAGVLALTMPLTIAIVVMLAIVVISYQQTIRAYPSGGGSYIVASDNLGAVPALVAGAALLIDYVLTVSVSIAAGVAAITSAFPALYPDRVLLGVLAIALLTLGNLRGIRESGTIFAAPCYVYLFSVFGLLAYGLFRWGTGTLPPYTPPAGELDGAGQALGLLMILRAFASGSVALTGTEAVANGIPAFKPPESRNAGIVLILMGTFFGSIFLGMSFLATQLHIVPDPTEVETVVSQLTRTLVGTGWYYYLVQFATTVLLILAANTSFADFPRLASIMARDRFLPSQFVFRGERLAFNNGILALATIAAALIVVFQGSVTSLIPLYTVGVFVAFTLSQSGMVVRWRRLRQPGWRTSMAINAVGAGATGIVAVVVGVSKFALGAWVVLVLIPALVLMLLTIRRHYYAVADQLTVDPNDPSENPDRLAGQLHHYVLIPVAGLNRAAVRAIAYARSLTGEVAHRACGAAPDEASGGHAVIQAVHITDDLEEGRRLLEKWRRFDPRAPLVIVESPYRALVGPLLRYIDAVERRHPEGMVVVTVLLPEFVPAHFWEYLLHTQTALLLKGALLFRPRTAVASVPYHLHE